MKSNYISILAVVLSFVFVFTVSIPASAVEWEDTNITLIDYLDYCDSEHLLVDGDRKFVVINLPADYAESAFISSTDNSAFGDGANDKVDVPAGDDNSVKFVSYPTLDLDYSQSRTRDGFMFDASHLPAGATVSFSWTVDLSNYSGTITNLDNVFDYWCYYFGKPDQHGWSYRLGRTELFGLPAYMNGGKKIVNCYAEYTHGSNTVGTTSNYFAPCIRIANLEFSSLPATFYVRTSAIRVEFPITDELFSVGQNEKTQKMLNEINRQLDEQGKTMNDILNGTPEQNEIAGNISGALTDKGDQLGDLVDDIQTEKPNVDDVDTNNIIPQTGITTLSGAISPIAENPLIIKILVMVGTLLLVSYVLFGKRG